MSTAAVTRGEFAIEVEDLRRTYRTNTGTRRRRRLDGEAVRGISLHVAKGELFGLIGLNGARKTTTVRARSEPLLMVPVPFVLVLMGSSFVLFRKSNAISNMLEYPVWPVTRLLVPAASCTGFGMALGSMGLVSCSLML